MSNKKEKFIASIYYNSKSPASFSSVEKKFSEH